MAEYPRAQPELPSHDLRDLEAKQDEVNGGMMPMPPFAQRLGGMGGMMGGMGGLGGMMGGLGGLMGGGGVGGLGNLGGLIGGGGTADDPGGVA